MIQVGYSRKFKKQLKKCPNKIQLIFPQRLKLFLKDKSNPLLRHHALVGKRAGFFSINLSGDWRALYEKCESDKIIFVEIGTHSQLY